jgi:Zn-dependent peptidase ImmA (M78 family)
VSEVSLAQIRAREIIRRLPLESPADISIEDIAWVRGALVIENGLRGAEARLVHTPDLQPAIIRVNATIREAGRKRFAIAHELGHLELNHNPGEVTECAEKHFLLWYKGQNQNEVEANVFAAELLMPEELFRVRLQETLPSMELIETLAAEFRTTLTATAIRHVDLCEERCALVFSTDGKVAWVRRSPEFHHWIEPKRTLSSYTYAFDFFSKGSTSEKMETVRLDAWVEESVSARDTVKEQSKALPSYNSVLTLLWIPQPLRSTSAP